MLLRFGQVVVYGSISLFLQCSPLAALFLLSSVVVVPLCRV